MKKRALFIGLTYDGTSHVLTECANDVRTNAEYIKRYAPWEAVVVTQASLDWNDLIGLRSWLAGSDHALFYYSGHGYRLKEKNAIETGLYMGKTVSHQQMMTEFFQPVLAQCGQLLRIYDCCYSGSARRKAGEQDDAFPVIKCLDFGACEEPGDIDAYKPVNEKNDAVIAACRAKQYAYGAFRGGPGKWCTLNTMEHSLFSYLFASSLLWRTNLNPWMSAEDLAWKCRNVLNSFLPYKEYKNRHWQVAQVVNNMSRKFPYNFFVRH